MQVVYVKTMFEKEQDYVANMGLNGRRQRTYWNILNMNQAFNNKT